MATDFPIKEGYLHPDITRPNYLRGPMTVMDKLIKISKYWTGYGDATDLTSPWFDQTRTTQLPFDKVRCAHAHMRFLAKFV